MGLCENLPEALFGVHLHRWIVTYPLDKVIRPLNNWGLESNKSKAQWRQVAQYSLFGNKKGLYF